MSKSLVIPCLLLATVALLLAPAPATAEPDAATRAEAKRMFEELREEAAAIRGLPWRFDVPADFLTREQLRENLMKVVQEEIEPEELERDIRIARRVGILGPDEDPVELMLEMMGEMVAGYYNPKTKHLYLIEGMVGDAQKPVIIHELIHALEDQYIDLESLTKRFEKDPDRLFATQCVVEGSAEHARELYQQAHPEVAAAYMEGQQDPAMMQRQMKVMQKVPAWMMVSTLLHYDLGPRLVTRAVGDDYEGGMARLYAYGPSTQEHLLHPAKFLGPQQDYPQRIAFPEDLLERAGAEWSKLDEIAGGELDLAVFLDFFLGMTKGRLNLLLLMQGKYYVSRAAKAAEGWDGSRSMFLEKDGAPIAWIEVHAFDTEADATEALEALKDALARANGSTFESLGDATSEAGRTVDWRGRHGLGRLHQDGLFVYLLDGVDEADMETLWPLVRETAFTKDPRDTWDPERETSALEGLDVVSEEHGVGLALPEGWAETERSQPASALAVRKGETVGELTVQPSPAGLSMVLPMIESQLSKLVPGFDPSAKVRAPFGPSSGYRYDAKNVRIYLGEAPGKLLILRFEGPDALPGAGVEATDAIAKGVVVLED